MSSATVDLLVRVVESVFGGEGYCLASRPCEGSVRGVVVFRGERITRRMRADSVAGLMLSLSIPEAVVIGAISVPDIRTASQEDNSCNSIENVKC